MLAIVVLPLPPQGPVADTESGLRIALFVNTPPPRQTVCYCCTALGFDHPLRDMIFPHPAGVVQSIVGAVGRRDQPSDGTNRTVRLQMVLAVYKHTFGGGHFFCLAE